MVAGRGATLPPDSPRRSRSLWSDVQRRSSSPRSTCLHDSQRLRRPTSRSRPHGGTATATRCCPTSFAGRRARTATSRSQPSACAPREPARRSAAHGCIRASAFRPAASIAEPATTQRQASSFRRRDTKGWQGGLEVSWEVDIAGRLRAGAAAAAADTLAVENTARGVRLLVVSDVATNYFTLVGALRQLDTVRAISAAQDETLRLVTARQRAGLATPFDVERAQTEASKARAAIPPLETLAAVSRHRIAVLIGDQAFNAASIVPSRATSRLPTPRRDNPPRCCSAGPTCSLRKRSSTPPMRAASRRWPNGSRGSFSARCSAEKG